MTPANSALKGLPKRLVQDGLLAQETAEEALRHCEEERLPFVQHIVSTNLLPAHLVAMVAANEFGSPLLDLDAFNIDSAPKDLIDNKLIKHHKALPLFARGNRLSLGVCDPTNHQTVREIEFQTGMTIEPVLVEYDKLEAAIDSFLNQQEEDLGEALGTLDDVHLDDLDVTAVEDQAEEDHSSDADDAPIVRFINKLLLDAIKLGASDIHFEPYERSYRVRFRVDGVLQEVSQATHQPGTPAGGSPESNVANGYLRAAYTPGWPHQTETVQIQGHRLSGKHPAHPLRRKNCTADTGFQQCKNGY